MKDLKIMDILCKQYFLYVNQNKVKNINFQIKFIFGRKKNSTKKVFLMKMFSFLTVNKILTLLIFLITVPLITRAVNDVIRVKNII